MLIHKTPLEVAAGKLISAIQREWGAEVGEAGAKVSEAVMYEAHELLQAAKTDSLLGLLGTESVANFLGSDWVNNHPGALSSIQALESLLSSTKL